MFLLQQEIDAPHDNCNHHVPHDCEEQDQDTILTHATILSHTFALPQFMDQHNYEDQEDTYTPSTIPTAFQAHRDDTYNPECTHNPMAILCNQYPNPSHNSALPQFRHTTIMRTWIPLTLQVQYQPLSKLPHIVPITLLQARLRKAIIPTLWLSHTHQILGSMLWKGLLHQQLL